MLSAALEYASRGWPVLPLYSVVNGVCTCRAGANCSQKPGKHPACGHGFKDATTDEAQIRRWFNGAEPRNIGILMGAASGLVALDCDSEEAHEYATTLGLPDTLSVETGRGKHFLYKHPGVRIRSGDKILKKVAPDLPLDVKGDDGYIVAPPSFHMSGKRYMWANDCAIAPLPQWVVDLRRERGMALPDVSHINLDETDLDKAAEALKRIHPDASYDDWIAVGMALHSTGDPQAFQIWDEWSARGSKYKGTKEIKTRWQSFKSEGITLGTIFHLAGGIDSLPSVTVRPVERHITKTTFSYEPPPGVVLDLMRYILATAPKPLPSAAMTGALAFAANAMGRVVQGPTGLRTNLYIVQLADTGCGKDHPRKIIKRIQAIMAADERNNMSPDDKDKRRPMIETEIGEGTFSDSAIISGLVRNPRRLMLLDEFGRHLAVAVSEGNGGLTSRAFDMFTKAATSAESDLHGPEYADLERAPRVIHFPCLNILGSAAPDTLWPALRSDAVASGFLPRFIFVIDRSRPKRADPAQLPLPLDVIEWVNHVRSYRGAGGNLAWLPDNPFAIRRNTDAQELMRGFGEYCDEQGHGRDIEGHMWTRAWEHVDKLLTILAVASSYRPELDTIEATGEHAEWAIAFVAGCIRSLAGEANHHVADTAYGAERQRALLAFVTAGSRGLTPRDIQRHPILRQFRPKERGAIIKDLVDAGEIINARIVPPGGGRPREAIVYSEAVQADE